MSLPFRQILRLRVPGRPKKNSRLGSRNWSPWFIQSEPVAYYDEGITNWSSMAPTKHGPT